MPDKIAQTGRQAALAAGAVLRQNYHKPHQITMKGAIDPVTESDLQSQEMIIALIRQAFPDHGFLAEETAGEGGVGRRPRLSLKSVTPAWPGRPTPSRLPLDHRPPGRHGQLRPRLPGLLRLHRLRGGRRPGIRGDLRPLRDELFEAQRGAGASLNGRPIRVSATERLDRALIATGFPYDIRERVPETLARLGRMLGIVQGLRRGGSAALDLCYVACGRLDGFYEENLKPWDTAAGLLIVTEAGGKITTFDGGDYDLYSPNILASNGVLHDKIIDIIKS